MRRDCSCICHVILRKSCCLGKKLLCRGYSQLVSHYNRMSNNKSPVSSNLPNTSSLLHFLSFQSHLPTLREKMFHSSHQHEEDEIDIASTLSRISSRSLITLVNPDSFSIRSSSPTHTEVPKHVLFGLCCEDKAAPTRATVATDETYPEDAVAASHSINQSETVSEKDSLAPVSPSSESKIPIHAGDQNTQSRPAEPCVEYNFVITRPCL